MAHRSQQLGPFGMAMINGAVNTLVFLVAWIFMPWWAALILAFVGFTAWLLVEHVDWSEIDWDGLWWWM